MLPHPNFSFAIPCIHDDTTLDCRVYIPPVSFYEHQDNPSNGIPGGAIVGHPYAGLGGCYDDHVVLASTTEMLRQGFVVGTFNFRGAAPSKGRTSWSGKPELYDYMSFVGFLVFFMAALHIPGAAESMPDSPEASLQRIPTEAVVENKSSTTSIRTKLILGGYSYGSLIASHLPAIEVVLQRFTDIQKGTAEAEIRLRAASLAAQWNQDAQLLHEIRRDRSLKAQGDRSLSANALSVAVGGDESEPGSRRPSRESRRSIDVVRRSFERTRKSLGRRLSHEFPLSFECEARLTSIAPRAPQVYYLLISPLLPPVSSFATMFSKLSTSRSHEGPLNEPAPHEQCDRLTSCGTLAIYGGKDIFISQKKLRAWSEALRSKTNSRFDFHEVSTAGHFWRGEGHEAELRHTVRDWLKQIMASSGSDE